MSEVVSVNEQNFIEEVLESEKPVLVDFWAPWCGYCIKLSPIFDELAKENSEKMKLVKFNVDENRALAQKLGVMSLPTMILFKEGEQVERTMGFMPKAVLEAKFLPFL
ncbi:Thioredoxin 1 [bioreactor metagenome]|uniref:Thioredoxin 1 n=1 Tax=bioreactor metagenome TaxID=1076179 RepID=A0A644T183_9ZZZZ